MSERVSFVAIQRSPRDGSVMRERLLESCALDAVTGDTLRPILDRLFQAGEHAEIWAVDATGRRLEKRARPAERRHGRKRDLLSLYVELI